MLIACPRIDGALAEQLDELAALRGRLGVETHRSLRWMGTLRRLVRATAVESSTSIEGYSVSEEEAIALVHGDEPPGGSDESRMAVAG
jgi:hypothetical protein